MGSNSKTKEQLLEEVKELRTKVSYLEKSVSEYQDIVRVKLEVENEAKGLFQRNQLILDTALDSYVLADTNGNIIDINQSYIELIGYSRDELLNMNIRQLEVAMPPEEVERRIQEMVTQGKDRFEAKHKHKNGNILILDTSICILSIGEAPMIAAFMRNVTDNQHAIKAIKESEFLLRESQKVAALGSYILDFNSQTWEGSSFIKDLYGIDDHYPTDVPGWLQIVHPKDRAMMQEYFQINILVNKEPFNKEYRILTINDQKERWVHGLGRLEFDDKGNPIRMMGTVQDITERKLVDEALRISELRFRTIIEQAADALFIIDFEGNIIEVNDKASENLGYTKDELLSMKMSRIDMRYDAVDIEYRNSMMISMEKGESVNVETNHRRKDGSTIPVESSIGIIEIKGRQVILGFARDISKRKKAEEELLKLNMAINNSSEVIFMTDKEGIITFVNSEFTKLYGFTAEEVLGKKTPRILKSDKVGREGSEYLWKTLLSKQSLPASQYVNKRKNGTLIDIEGSADPIVDENDDIIGFLGIQRDITERKRAEQNLIEAMEKAKESDRMKSTFLATMSHELRTPLNAIIGFSDIIDEKYTVKEIVEYANIINSSGNQLLSIVEDLFDITLIDTGEVRIRNKEENLASIMKYIYEIMDVERYTASRGHLEFKLKYPSQSKNLTINTDPVKLKQILINLLRNALKFTKEGHVHFGYELEKDQSGRFIKFYVEDTGIGILENKKEIIFDIFRQIEDSPTSTLGGTGIGLSIAKKLTELLGGKIWLDSVEGEGTVFYFTIPIEGQHADDETIEEGKNEISLKKSNFDLKTILIVEDDEPSYKYLKIVLQNSGMNPIWADSGLKAIEHCRNNGDIDLVLMDINMPEMNGHEATRVIKKSNPGMPIIAQTAFAIAGDKQKILQAGCDDYISKPINKKELLQKIKKYL